MPNETDTNRQSRPAIDRRRFLSACAGASALAVGLGSARAGERVASTQPGSLVREPQVPKPPPVRKALKFGMINEGDSIADKLKIARDAGFEGVEFDAPSNLDIDEVLKAKDAAGIDIPGVVDSAHWSKPLSHPDPEVRLAGRHALEKALYDCKALGGSQVLLVPAVVNADVSYRDAFDRAVTEIRRVMPLVRETGVGIALENVWNNFLLSPLEAKRFIEAVVIPTENSVRKSREGYHRLLGWYFDVGNIWRYGWPAHWLEELGGPSRYISRLDIKGYSRAKADKEGKWAGFGVEIGDGDIPWETVRAWIDASGWTGWATAEVGGGNRDRLADIASRMDRVLGLKNG